MNAQVRIIPEVVVRPLVGQTSERRRRNMKSCIRSASAFNRITLAHTLAVTLIHFVKMGHYIYIYIVSAIGHFAAYAKRPCCNAMCVFLECVYGVCLSAVFFDKHCTHKIARVALRHLINWISMGNWNDIRCVDNATTTFWLLSL